MTRTRLAVAPLVLLLLAGVAATALATAEVVAKGRLVPSGGAGVRRVRVWDAFEFYISSETARPPLDVITTLTLATLAGVLGFAALTLIIGGVRDRLALCFAVGSAGAGCLAADELLAIHESVGHNLQALRRLPGVDRPDDVVLMGYAVPGAAFAWVFRGVLLSVRASVLLFAAAVGLAVLASACDLLGATGIEENAEALAAVLLATAFVLLAAVRVPAALRAPVTTGS